jgi:hypothetical protein
MISFEINAMETKTYYSEFGEYKEGYQEPSDLIEVSSYYKYKYYYKDTVLGDYYIYGENDYSYPFIKEDDIEFTEFSERTTIRPEEKPNRSIATEEIFYYKDMKEIRYIFLYNIKGTYGAFRISEIEIYAGVNEIDFSIECGVCSPTFNQYVTDGNRAYRSDSLIYNGSYMMIDLNNYYPADSISFNMYLYETSNNPQTYSVAFTKEPSLDIKYFNLDVTKSFKSFNPIEVVKDEYNINVMNLTNPEYYDEQESYTPVYSTKTRVVRYVKYYSYSDVLYRYYNEVYIYSEDYLDGPDGLYINLSDFKEEYFTHRKRDKLVIKYPITITNDTYNLDDYILLCTSSCSYELVKEVDRNYVLFKVNDSVYEEEINIILNKTNKEIAIEKKDEIKTQIEVKKELKELTKKEKENKNTDINKMIALPFALIFLIPTYFYFKTEYKND